ncbi:sigma-70 family RNA polymerase sigma factor [Jatrophihabitans sp. DSM 45814]
MTHPRVSTVAALGFDVSTGTAVVAQPACWRALRELVALVVGSNDMAAHRSLGPIDIDPEAADRGHAESVHVETVDVETVDAETDDPEVGSGHGLGPDRNGLERVDAEHVEMWELVRAAKDGDGEAFGKLYDRYVDAVFRFIFYRVNDRALAEDFTSETFLRALRRISTINYQGRDIGAWFMTIARNIVFDHTKSARFRLEMTTGDLIEGDEKVASTESAVLTHLTNERLMRALDSLGEEQKECLVLRFLNGLSVAETAEVMGKNDGAIKALQHRAVKRLAALVADELR